LLALELHQDLPRLHAVGRVLPGKCRRDNIWREKCLVEGVGDLKLAGGCVRERDDAFASFVLAAKETQQSRQ
jgi:hypothetical protein